MRQDTTKNTLIAELLAVLKTKPGKPEWSPGIHEKLYLQCIEYWDAYLLNQVLQWVSWHEEWRPDTAGLLRIAARFACEIPDSGVLWVEFWHKMIHAGYDRPRWTHPILEDIAAKLGGWRYLYSRNPHFEPRGHDVYSTRFSEGYRAVVAEWQHDIIDQLRIPAYERHERYQVIQHEPFNPPRSLPHESEVGLRLLPSPVQLLERAPDELKILRQSLRLIGGQGDGRRSSLTREDKERIERELAERRSARDSEETLETE